MESMKFHISEAERIGMRLRIAFPTRAPEVCWLQWSPDGEALVSQHWDIRSHKKDSCFWNWKTADVLFELAPVETQTSNTFDFAWSPTGDKIAMSAQWEGEACLTDGQALNPGDVGVEVRRIIGKSEATFFPFKADYGALSFVHWLPGGNLIAAASEGTFRIIDADTGDAVRILDSELGKDIAALAISPDGRTAVGINSIGIVSVFDLSTWEIKRNFLDPSNLFTVKWSPTDNIYAATVQSGPILLYSTNSDRPIGELNGHEIGADNISFSADGALLSSVGRDSTVRIWSIKECRELAVFYQAERYGPTDWVFHPKQPVAAIWNDEDKRIEVWDVNAAALSHISLLREEVTQAQETSASVDLLDEDFVAPEGREQLRLHRQRERNKTLVARRKQQALEKDGCLRCEVCGLVFAEFYGPLGEDYIECHHTRPVSTMGPGQETSLTDLALVCANCHRMLHRGEELLTIAQLRQIIESIRGSK